MATQEKERARRKKQPAPRYLGCKMLPGLVMLYALLL